MNWSRACLSPDGGLIAAGSVDGSIYIWNSVSGKIDATLTKEHTFVIDNLQSKYKSNQLIPVGLPFPVSAGPRLDLRSIHVTKTALSCCGRQSKLDEAQVCTNVNKSTRTASEALLLPNELCQIIVLFLQGRGFTRGS